MVTSQFFVAEFWGVTPDERLRVANMLRQLYDQAR